jgi:hypothetical protein
MCQDSFRLKKLFNPLSEARYKSAKKVFRKVQGCNNQKDDAPSAGICLKIIWRHRSFRCYTLQMEKRLSQPRGGRVLSLLSMIFSIGRLIFLITPQIQP